MSLPQIASRGEWLIGREEVLAQHRTAARARDAAESQRQRLPMIKLDKGYEFVGPGGECTLSDLFHGLRRLLLCHFMLDSGQAGGCASCDAAAAEVSDDLLARLRARDTAFVAISHAPLAVIEQYKGHRGWAFPWYACSDTDFGHDFPGPAQSTQSVFQREGARLFHSYSMFARGPEALGSWCYRLDLTTRNG